MLGARCLKTWSSTQGAVALNSAEAEFYAMIEATLRTKGLRSLALEMGFNPKMDIINLWTDSTAATSFVSRRGLGKMRHVEIRDVWLQREIGEGRVWVFKVKGDENPADLMTKILKLEEIRTRLGRLSIVLTWRGE